MGLSMLVACNKPKTEEKPGVRPAQADEAPVITEPVSLEIDGFNYTDLYIDSFEVNGQGGGNLFVSSPTSGGGGGVCCMSFSPGTNLPVQLRIKWTRERKRWCEKEALLTGPVPANPRYLGVHFFPDGHIEAEITENDPEPRLRLERVDRGKRKQSGNAVADEQTARCKDGY
ncbi:DUF3304 domain-containing protein [Archangium gephyra]|uniref:DUF3304 domain-containing protein n=1 Tax=Archangium gephyra TaxID=48 RepID=UPI0035D4AD5F